MLSGVSPSTVGHWETGQDSPSLTQLAKVVEVLESPSLTSPPFDPHQVTLADLRQRRGITQATAAEAFGMSKSHWAAAETGARILAEQHVGLFAEYFQVGEHEVREAATRSREAVLRRALRSQPVIRFGHWHGLARPDLKIPSGRAAARLPASVYTERQDSLS